MEQLLTVQHGAKTYINMCGRRCLTEKTWLPQVPYAKMNPACLRAIMG